MNNKEYFSLEADNKYMSVSQYKNFRKCQASELARLKGEYKRKVTDAFLIGSYIHSWSEGTLDKFKEDHPEIMLKDKSGPKAKFKQADNMIQVLEDDEWIMKFLTGDKEVIMTGELFGVHWKIMIDVLNIEKGFFSDLKTVQKIKKDYGPTFIEEFGYIEQMAVYQQIILQNTGKLLVPYVVAVEKSDIPDKAVIRIDSEDMEDKLFEIEHLLPEIMDVKEGKTKAKRCEKCDYCKSTKKVNKVLSLEDLRV